MPHPCSLLLMQTAPAKTAEQPPMGNYLILELEISSSTCIRCRSPPSFSLRFSVTWARKGFLASNGLEGKTRTLWVTLQQLTALLEPGVFLLPPEQPPTIRAQGCPSSCFRAHHGRNQIMILLLPTLVQKTDCFPSKHSPAVNCFCTAKKSYAKVGWGSVPSQRNALGWN